MGSKDWCTCAVKKQVTSLNAVLLWDYHISRSAPCKQISQPNFLSVFIEVNAGGTMGLAFVVPYETKMSV